MANKLVWRSASVDYLLNNRFGPVGQDLMRRARNVQQAAKGIGPRRRQVGVNTGRLRESINIKWDRTATGQKASVGSDLKYALAHHEGTRPHVILPVRAQALAFPGRGGTMIITKRVNHPGTRPNRYLSDNLYRALD